MGLGKHELKIFCEEQNKKHFYVICPDCGKKSSVTMIMLGIMNDYINEFNATLLIEDKLFRENKNVSTSNTETNHPSEADSEENTRP